MPIDYRKYHPDWKTKIRPAILARAQNRCEDCKLPNYAEGYRDETGEFVNVTNGGHDTALKSGRKLFRIVLTVAHLNHDIKDNRPSNLRALCQQCHLRLDAKFHQTARIQNNKGRFYERFSC